MYRSELSFWFYWVWLCTTVESCSRQSIAEHMQCILCSSRPRPDAQAFTFGWVAPLVGGRLDLFTKLVSKFSSSISKCIQRHESIKIWGTSDVKTSLVFTKLCFVLNALDLSLAHPDVNNYAGIGEFHPNHSAELLTSSLSGWWHDKWWQIINIFASNSQITIALSQSDGESRGKQERRRRNTEA